MKNTPTIITSPSQIETPLWEGYLESPGEMLKADHPRAKVTIGQPDYWPIQNEMEYENGKKWSPPLGSRRYCLVRLACTLHPPEQAKAHYTDARIGVSLRPRLSGEMPIAHDLHPLSLTAETKNKYTLGLDPGLKFGKNINLKLFKAGYEIECSKAFPVITAYGLGEKTPYWQCNSHPSHLLLGSQSFFMVLSIPENAGGAYLSIDITATIEGRYGFFRLKSSETVSDYKFENLEI